MDWVLISLYFDICKEFYSDDFKVIQGLRNDSTIYSGSDIDHACAECAYILENNKLPDWAITIESFEVTDDGYVFIYRDEINKV